MQQHESFPGMRNRSKGRRRKVNFSDFINYSGAGHENRRLSPRFTNVQDAPPEPYNPHRNVQENLPDRYGTVQGYSTTDGCRNVQGRSSPDRYRYLQSKPLPNPSRKVPDKPLSGSAKNVPNKSLPDFVRKVPDKSLPDSSRKVPDKSLPDNSSRKVPDKSLPDSSKNLPDKSLPDNSSRKVPDKSLPDSSRKVPDMSFPDSSKDVYNRSSPYRYRNVPDVKKGDMQHSTKLPCRQESQSQLGGVTSREFTSRLGTVRSPVLRSPIIIPPVNVQPLPMTFMLQFPPPHLVPCPPAVKSYQTADIANEAFCDFDQYPSSLPQPTWDSWENYPEMDRSSFCFNPEAEPFDYSYWTDSGVEQPAVHAVPSDTIQTEYSEYSAAYDDAEYNASFFAEPPLVECSAGHDTVVLHKGYSDTNLLTSVQTVQPHFAPMIAAPQTAVVSAPVPRGIVSRSIRSFLPHFMQPKTTFCQSEKRFVDASTNTQTSGTSINACTNTELGLKMSVGTNTEAAELISVSTITDQVEMRTIATNTELSDVHRKEMRSVGTDTALSGVLSTNQLRMAANSILFDVVPTRETTAPSEVMHQSESGTSFGGAKPKRQLDSRYTYCRSIEDETVDHSHNISRTSSSEHAPSDVMSDPECSLRQQNIQKDAKQGKDSSCTGKLHSADIEKMSKAKRNLASKSDLDEIYYSDENSPSDADEKVKEPRVSSVIRRPDDRDRLNVLRSPDFFPKWTVMAATASSSPLSPASTHFKMPLSPDLTKLRDYPTGNLMLPQYTSTLPGFSLLHKDENQTFLSAASNAYSATSSPSHAPSLHSSQPVSLFKPECFPDSAGDASLVHAVLIENAALTGQIMTLLLNVNPLFALDPPAHRLAAFNELMLVKRCRLEMKMLQQHQKVAETCLQHESPWNDVQASRNNESTFGNTVVKEQQLSRSQLDQCMERAAFNSSNVPQRQQDLRQLEGWPTQCLEKERQLQKQPHKKHVQHEPEKIYTGCNDLQTGDESYLNPDYVKMNHPSEEMEEKPFRQLRHQRRIVGTKEGNAYWRDRFARQKASEWHQTPNTSKIQNEERVAEKMSELSEITVEDSKTKTQGSSDEETWQKVCRKKKTVRTVKESGPKKFNRR